MIVYKFYTIFKRINFCSNSRTKITYNAHFSTSLETMHQNVRFLLFFIKSSKIKNLRKISIVQNSILK